VVCTPQVLAASSSSPASLAASAAAAAVGASAVRSVDDANHVSAALTFDDLVSSRAHSSAAKLLPCSAASGRGAMGRAPLPRTAGAMSASAADRSRHALLAEAERASARVRALLVPVRQQQRRGAQGAWK
jgi:hypothetical protein